jgi:beta-aspartyl-peptidase (threonine type)
LLVFHYFFEKFCSHPKEFPTNDVKRFSMITLAIHGGAGTILKSQMTDEKEQAYKQALQESLLTGYQVLASGGTSTEAVVAAIRCMEDSPLFNAGKGAVFTHDKTHELDASLMEGRTHKAGAIAGVSTIKNPIVAAKHVMENSEHVLLAGKGAENFAQKQGLDIVNPEYFDTDFRYQQLLSIIDSETTQLDHSDKAQENGEKKFGTVGAVALDQYGNLAAGTSTGGMTNKRYGRVGDTPIIGAGTYADNATCAVSATGHGEFFIRYAVAYDIVALIRYQQLSVKDAAQKVIDKLADIEPDTGGVIALDAQGNVTMPFNTEGMYRGYMQEGGQPQVFIYE